MSDTRVAQVFVRVARGFWRGETAFRAALLTIGLGLSVASVVGITVAINRWNRWFFDALERRDGVDLGWAAGALPLLVTIAAGCGVLVVLMRETLQVRWRAWLTARLLSLWMERRRYHRLREQGIEPSNPEYRIADDVRIATEPVIDFVIGLFQSLLGAVTFLGILWSVGGSMTLQLPTGSVTIPGFMVIAALIYGLCASLVAAMLGRPLVACVGAKNEAEARFRFELMRVREHADSIAQTRSDTIHQASLGRHYETVVARGLAVVERHGHLTWITNGSGVLVPLVPLVLCIPNYLSGALTLGAVIQLAAAFVAVQMAFSWLVDNMRMIALWFASARRVVELIDAFESLDGRDTINGPETDSATASTPDDSTDWLRPVAAE